MPLLRIAICLLGGLVLGATAQAQPVAPGPVPAQAAPPMHLALVDGTGTLTREGLRDEALTGTSLLPGDLLRTDRGRVEIVLPDGSILALDEYSTLEVVDAARFILTEGQVILAVSAAIESGDGRVLVESRAGTAELSAPGDYRISLMPSGVGMQMTLDATRGTGMLRTERGETLVRQSERTVTFANGVPSAPQRLDGPQYDAFGQWTRSLQGDPDRSASARYLPEELQTYSGAFDRYGSWSYDNAYGDVWYPNVAAGWQPYQDGYWDPLPIYGWTWSGGAVWGWPTHHYGRWGYAGSRWFWIPGRVWAPSWVAWGSAPGYVSWSPLGFNNRPVFALSVSAGRGWGAGWTFVARDRFDGPRSYRRGFGYRSMIPPARTGFVAHDAAPIALPRRTAASRTFTAPRSPLAPSAPGRVGADQQPRPGTSPSAGRRRPESSPTGGWAVPTPRTGGSSSSNSGASRSGNATSPGRGEAPAARRAAPAAAPQRPSSPEEGGERARGRSPNSAAASPRPAPPPSSASGQRQSRASGRSPSARSSGQSSGAAGRNEGARAVRRAR